MVALAPVSTSRENSRISGQGNEKWNSDLYAALGNISEISEISSRYYSCSLGKLFEACQAKRNSYINCNWPENAFPGV